MFDSNKIKSFLLVLKNAQDLLFGEFKFKIFINCHYLDVFYFQKGRKRSNHWS